MRKATASLAIKSSPIARIDPGTCTWLGEWAETLRHYKWRCAYCTGPFESIDHFTPVSQGGATWVGNVVPACLACQMAKGGQLPQEVTTIQQDVITRIARYLERRVKERRGTR